MLRSLVPVIVLALLAPALLSAAAVAPTGADGGLSVTFPAYAARLTWPSELSPSPTAATIELEHAGRTGTISFDARLRSDIFLSLDTTLRPMLVDAQVTLGGTPHVVLVYDMAATGALAESTSTLAFTFHEDRIEFVTTAHHPSAILAPYLEGAVTFGWDDAWAARGILLPDGAPGDDNGAALDAYQEWQNTERYGVVVSDPGAAVGLVRVAQGSDVNYLVDGEWRVSRNSMRASTAFVPFVDAPTVGAPAALWTHDAILLGADPEAIGASMLTLGGTEPIPSRASQDQQVVIALMDTGINPYHVAFRDDTPLGQQHPSTYLPGFPADAEAVHLTLDAADLDSALAADDAVWRSLVAEKLYWFPGTKIVGAISTGEGNESPGMIFSTGHGTMTASRAAANEYSLCPECRIVMVQGGAILGDASARYVRWTADQTWIDIQSHSWSGFVPFQNEIEVPGIRDASEYAAAQMPFFASAGNGAAGKGGVLGHPAFTRPMSGGEGVIPVGGHDNGYVTAWTAQYPYVAADACDSWAAVGDSTSAFDPTVGGGTSAATPYAAGEAGRLVLEARRILGGPGDRAVGILAAGAARPDLGASPLADGVFTLDELKGVLFRTATARPSFTRDDGVVCSSPLATPSNTLPYAWTDFPSDVSAYPFIGWGGIDALGRDRALDVLRGVAALPVRPLDEQAHADAEALRRAYWSVEPATPPVPEPVAQDDAGSGRDAGDTPATSVPVSPGVVHRGMLLQIDDWVDLYGFDAIEGQTLEVRAAGSMACVTVEAPNGSTLEGGGCPIPGLDELVPDTFEYVLPATGRYHLRMSNPATSGEYRFSLGLDASAPALDPVVSLPRPPQDDAGSGADAPSGPAGAPLVAPGSVHRAQLLGPGFGDDVDVFAFDARAGERMTLMLRAPVPVCYRVHGPDGSVVAQGLCHSPLDEVLGREHAVPIASDGVHYLRLANGLTPTTYAFSFSFAGYAPEPGIAGTLSLADDAGTGADAPDAWPSALFVAPNVVHEGSISAIPLDGRDVYALHLDAGDDVSIRFRALEGCLNVVKPDGAYLGFGACSMAAAVNVDLSFTAATAGVWSFQVGGVGPQPYAFAYAIDGEAPDVQLPIA